MYVKSLRLAGFKSFATPTVLDFEPGVNVIVGPNGSGKSNIADALQWVLGSQAPSSLRSASMEDVIFAGAAGRPALGMAEVALTLDNSNRILPLDLSEVTISRSTDRSGETEYRINGASCRLLDIQELLSDTGIGRSIHTIVGQGQLDAVLHARPEDRRTFIEEAAQIGKYRRRKDRSLRKIERVDDNLVRLNDVLVELRRAIRPLKRQANAASAYSELMARHRTLRQQLAATEIARLTAESRRFDTEADSHRTALLEDELAGLRARLDGVGAEREEAGITAETAQMTAHRMARITDRLSSLSRLAGERAEKIAAELAAETEEGYRERIRLLDRERIRWSHESKQLEGDASAKANAAREARGRLDETHRRLEHAEANVSRARHEETAAAQALVRAEGSEAAGRATLGAIEARVHSAAERREVAHDHTATDAQAVTKAVTEVETLERELDAITEAAATAESELESARERADALRSDLGGEFAHVAGATARVSALEEVLGLFPGDQRVHDVIQPLLERARSAVEVASAGERETRRVLAKADEVVEQRWREVARLDDELRRLDALMSGAAERLAGARRQREAREIEVATLDDELARARDALADAERAAAEERAALPARRGEVEEMRTIRENAEREVASIRQEMQSVTQSASESEIESRGAAERVLAAQLRVEEAEAGMADARAALEGLEDRRSALTAARERAGSIARLAAEGARWGAVWSAAAEERAVATREAAHEAERRWSDLRERERSLVEGLEDMTRRRNEAEIRRAETNARVTALGERAMEEWGLSLDALSEITGLEGEAEVEAHAEVEKLERELKRLGAVNPNAAEEYAELAERERFLEEQIKDLDTSRRDLMKVVREVDATIVQVFGEAFEAVAREFEGVFGRLFPGGSGSLKLTDPDDLLGSGIEVEARPPGKNVKKLSLLSGGERSLVALAFLFAIFRSRPSPFYLLDEVEAALDDINLLRFLTLIEELEERAQVLIVTHQKRTMEAADVLYGVSMAKDGVSAVIAKRMEDVTL